MSATTFQILVLAAVTWLSFIVLIVWIAILQNRINKLEDDARKEKESHE